MGMRAGGVGAAPAPTTYATNGPNSTSRPWVGSEREALHVQSRLLYSWYMGCAMVSQAVPPSGGAMPGW
eukprot:354792-Chlamydomonas_euryale.AAC.8